MFAKMGYFGLVLSDEKTKILVDYTVAIRLTMILSRRQSNQTRKEVFQSQEQLVNPCKVFPRPLALEAEQIK